MQSKSTFPSSKTNIFLNFFVNFHLINVNLGYCPCMWELLCCYEESTTTTTYYGAFQRLRCPSPRTFIPIVVNTPAFFGRALTLNFFVPSIKFASWDQGRSEGLQKSLAILTLARSHATPLKRKNFFILDVPRRSEIYIKGCQSADSYLCHLPEKVHTGLPADTLILVPGISFPFSLTQ